MARTKRARIEDDTSPPPSPPNDPASKETPHVVGTSFIRTAILALSTSLGTTLPFLLEFASQNLKLFKELKLKQATVENLKIPGKYARSIRFKFKLEASAKLAETEEHKNLEPVIKTSLETCQKEIQETITKSRVLELKLLREEKAEHCLRFLCFFV